MTTLANIFRSGYTLRSLLIDMISDTYKEKNGFRPRWNYGAMNLVDLWAAYKEVDAMSYLYEEDDPESGWMARESEFQRVNTLVAQNRPDQWDDVADALEGITHPLRPNRPEWQWCWWG